MTSKSKLVLISRGKAGWHAIGVSDWGSGPNHFSSSGGTLEGYLAEAEDGTYVADAEEANEKEFMDWVFKGPMVKADLPLGKIGCMNKATKKAMTEMLPALGGAYLPIAAGMLLDLCGSDFVAVDIYLAAFKERVPGVKFGKVLDHKIVWD